MSHQLSISTEPGVWGDDAGRANASWSLSARATPGGHLQAGKGVPRELSSENYTPGLAANVSNTYTDFVSISQRVNTEF